MSVRLLRRRAMLATGQLRICSSCNGSGVITANERSDREELLLLARDLTASVTELDYDDEAAYRLAVRRRDAAVARLDRLAREADET